MTTQWQQQAFRRTEINIKFLINRCLSHTHKKQKPVTCTWQLRLTLLIKQHLCWLWDWLENVTQSERSVSPCTRLAYTCMACCFHGDARLTGKCWTRFLQCQGTAASAPGWWWCRWRAQSWSAWKKNKNAGDASSCVIHAQSLTSNQIRDLCFWGINVNAKIIIFSLFIKRHYISFLLWPRS